MNTKETKSLDSIHIVTDYKICYPEIICKAFEDLYVEYNMAFSVLVEANREWPKDYQYTLQDDFPYNFAVQIDTLGLDDNFLRAAVDKDRETVREELRRKILEIKNPIEIYQLLERIFETTSGDNGFKSGWHAALNELRRKHGKPIALLTVTDQKYYAIRKFKFGRQNSKNSKKLSDSEISKLFGFDIFFKPIDFQTYLSYKKEEFEYLLFVRTSNPVSKLKNPKIGIKQSLLANPKTRRLIKKNAITFNIDNPEWPIGSYRRINKSKWYMPLLGMAFTLTREAEMDSAEFDSYLEFYDIDPNEVRSGRKVLCFTPAYSTYGCRGHLRGVLTNKKLRKKLRREISKHGHYMIRPEMQMPVITIWGREYTYMDRIFLAYIDCVPTFISGFRSLIPVTSAPDKDKTELWIKIYSLGGNIL